MPGEGSQGKEIGEEEGKCPPPSPFPLYSPWVPPSQLPSHKQSSHIGACISSTINRGIQLGKGPTLWGVVPTRQT
jgi:hypothetical protein